MNLTLAIIYEEERARMLKENEELPKELRGSISTVERVAMEAAKVKFYGATADILDDKSTIFDEHGSVTPVMVEHVDPPKHRPKVYLAGKMTGLSYEDMRGWRLQARKLLENAGFEVIDPTDQIERNSLTAMTYNGTDNWAYQAQPSEIIDVDVFHMSRADIVLAEFEVVNVSIGTICEVVIAARELHKPVVAWGTNPALSHAWVRGNITKRTWNMGDAIDFIIDVFRG